VIVRFGVSIASAAEVADKAPLLACASAIGMRRQPHPEERPQGASRRVGKGKAGCPPFETHRYAMLLRVRWIGSTISESALVSRAGDDTVLDDSGAKTENTLISSARMKTGNPDLPGDRH
jgi:hypothetical protein